MTGYQFVENWPGQQFVGNQFVGWKFVGYGTGIHLWLTKIRPLLDNCCKVPVRLLTVSKFNTGSGFIKCTYSLAETKSATLLTVRLFSV